MIAVNSAVVVVGGGVVVVFAALCYVYFGAADGGISLVGFVYLAMRL